MFNDNWVIRFCLIKCVPGIEKQTIRRLYSSGEETQREAKSDQIVQWFVVTNQSKPLKGRRGLRTPTSSVSSRRQTIHTMLHVPKTKLKWTILASVWEKPEASDVVALPGGTFAFIVPGPFLPHKQPYRCRLCRLHKLSDIKSPPRHPTSYAIRQGDANWSCLI